MTTTPSTALVVAFALVGVFAGGSRHARVTDTSESAPNASARFADLHEITPDNVARLAVAWTAHTGDFPGGQPNPKGAVEGFQTRPVLTGDLLIVTTTVSRIIALDAETGVERWRFDPFAGRTRRCELPHRGVALWERSTGPGATERTIFSGTCDGGWSRSMRQQGGRGRDSRMAASSTCEPGVDARAGEAYAMTSPPAIFRDLVIVGALVPEETSRGPGGDVRAFDVRTGREVWRFHTVPQPGEFGHETWAKDAWQRRTGANVWSSMTVDEAQRARVPADRLGVVRLLRRRSPRAQPVREFARRARRGDRARVAGTCSSCTTTSGITTRRRSRSSPTFRATARTVPVVDAADEDGPRLRVRARPALPVFGVEERPVPHSEVPGEAKRRRRSRSR